MAALAERHGLLPFVDKRASFTANQPLWSGSAVHRIHDEGAGVRLVHAAPVNSAPLVTAAPSVNRGGRWLWPSISGHGGGAALYRFANVLLHEERRGEAEAIAIIKRDFNPRCEPPWSDRDIERVVANASLNPRHVPCRKAEEWTPRTVEQRAYYDGWYDRLNEHLAADLPHGDVYTADDLLDVLKSEKSSGDRIWLGKVMNRMRWQSSRRGRCQQKVYVRPGDWSVRRLEPIDRFRLRLAELSGAR